MLLKIEVKPEDIIYNNNGVIIIKLHYYSAFANAAHLVTTDGNTKEDYYENRGKSNKTLFVGINGGISFR